MGSMPRNILCPIFSNQNRNSCLRDTVQVCVCSLHVLQVGVGQLNDKVFYNDWALVIGKGTMSVTLYYFLSQQYLFLYFDFRFEEIIHVLATGSKARTVQTFGHMLASIEQEIQVVIYKQSEQEKQYIISHICFILPLHFLKKKKWPP